MNQNKESPLVGTQEGGSKNVSTNNDNKISPPSSPVNLLVANIPDELKQLPHWICWKFEERDGKLTKVPISPFTRRKAASNNPKTWNSFPNALKYYQIRRKNGIDGIGFVFTDDDPYCGIDLDDCRDPETGELTPVAQEFVETCDSYAEISPSGKGIHIFVKAKLPTGGRKSGKLGLEVYFRSRYFTMTGNVLDSQAVIHDRQKEVDALLAKYFDSQPTSEPDPELQYKGLETSRAFTDDEIIDKARNAINGEKFERLRSGDWQEAGYPSQSEADAALCAILSFYTGPDQDRIDGLFRKSGLYREKWERDDYRERTMKKALEGTTEFYRPQGTTTGGASDDLSEANEQHDFPEVVMAGVAGEFAELFSSYLEVPKTFFYMTFLTCLGTALADRLTLATEIAPQPRLYVLLLGESADARKSTALRKTKNFFQKALKDFPVCLGIGSAEGLQKYLRESNRLLLCFDEFKQFVGKCRIEASVLLPCVNTLFEENRYESRTQKRHIKLENAYLSLLAASTVQTYENIWSSAFTDIGFNNRLFLVPGSGQRKFPIPQEVPDSEKRIIEANLDQVKHLTIKNPKLDISEEARSLYTSWYMNREPSIHSKRLGTYALRFMPLLAVNEMKTEVDDEIVSKVIALVNWELAVRKLHDPIDADSKMAKMEGKIRQQLSKSPMSQRDLKRNTNAYRPGLWIFKMALKNLQEANEVKYDKKRGKWVLIE